MYRAPTREKAGEEARDRAGEERNWRRSPVIARRSLTARVKPSASKPKAAAPRPRDAIKGLPPALPILEVLSFVNQTALRLGDESLSWCDRSD
jgi:hypothetical protein